MTAVRSLYKKGGVTLDDRRAQSLQKRGWVLGGGGGEGAGAARSGGGADVADALNDQDRKMLTSTNRLVALVVEGGERRRMRTRWNGDQVWNPTCMDCTVDHLKDQIW